MVGTGTMHTKCPWAVPSSNTVAPMEKSVKPDVVTELRLATRSPVPPPLTMATAVATLTGTGLAARAASAPTARRFRHDLIRHRGPGRHRPLRRSDSRIGAATDDRYVPVAA